MQYDEDYSIWVLDLLFVQSNISGSGASNQGSEVGKKEYGANAEAAGRSCKKCAILARKKSIALLVNEPKSNFVD